MVVARWLGLTMSAVVAGIGSASVVDVLGDGGVTKRLVRVGDGGGGAQGGTPPAAFFSGEASDRGMLVSVSYAARVASTGQVFEAYDAAAPLRFRLGAGEVIRGLDAAVDSMRVGDVAEVAVRFDYAYGEAGLADRGIPPRADLALDRLTVLAAEKYEDAEANPARTPALPAPGDAAERPSIAVGGDPVRLDHLGPMVVNKDGTLSRITNWPEMSEVERSRTLRVVGKRNRQRLADLRATDEPTPDLPSVDL